MGAVRQGLLLAWELGFKFIQLEIDSVTVLSWLIDTNSNFTLDVFPLICDCRSLMEWAWEVQVRHIYCEANESVDALVKWENHQQHLFDYLQHLSQFCIPVFCKGFGRPQE